MKSLRFFIGNFPHLVEEMRNCSYHLHGKKLNFHHLEGNVWTHTMMAYSQAIKHRTSEVIKWAVLLHDVGRILTRRVETDTKNVLFDDFEGVSVFLALGVLKASELTEEEKIRVLKIIAFQYHIIDYVKYNKPSLDFLEKEFKFEEQTLHDLADYVGCDFSGRLIDASRMHYYKPQIIEHRTHEIKHRIKQQTKELVKKKKTLYLLIGPPCSGKSSWIKHKSKKFFVVSRDECVEEIGRKYGKNTYDDAYVLMRDNRHIEKEVEALEEKIENDALTSETDVVVDNLNFKLNHRKIFINNFKKDFNIKAILFLVPFNELIERDKQRGHDLHKKIGKKSIISLLKRFSFPLLNEGIDEIEYFGDF